MKLSFEQIKSITVGAARVEENGERIAFFRFTKEQEEAYYGIDRDLYKKTFSTAGIRLEFVTNSTSLYMQVRATPGTSRAFFSHDIFVNDKYAGRIDARFEDLEHATPIFVGGKVYLGEGTKTVRIYFPWSFASELCELSLDDGATVQPVEKKRKMIIFGDSITHGYDAIVASNSYASKLADYLCADARNKAIGADIFRPAIAAMKDDFSPDIITVAYGTNDWGHLTKEEFDNNCEKFYDNLSKTYPNAKIFAIAPIWRADITTKDTQVGPLSYVADFMKGVADKHDNITFIDGIDLLPHDDNLFSDLYLHPNDEGFKYYAESLCKEIEKHI